MDLPGLHRQYALKQMCKRKLIKKNSVDAALNERAILSSLSFPFLVNLKAAFQDKDNLYLLMDYIGGGDPISRVGLTVLQAMGLQLPSWGTASLRTSKTITGMLA